MNCCVALHPLGGAWHENNKTSFTNPHLHCVHLVWPFSSFWLRFYWGASAVFGWSAAQLLWFPVATQQQQTCVSFVSECFWIYCWRQGPFAGQSAKQPASNCKLMCPIVCKSALRFDGANTPADPMKLKTIASSLYSLLYAGNSYSPKMLVTCIPYKASNLCAIGICSFSFANPFTCSRLAGQMLPNHSILCFGA